MSQYNLFDNTDFVANYNRLSRSRQLVIRVSYTCLPTALYFSKKKRNLRRNHRVFSGKEERRTGSGSGNSTCTCSGFQLTRVMNSQLEFLHIYYVEIYSENRWRFAIHATY